MEGSYYSYSGDGDEYSEYYSYADEYSETSVQSDYRRVVELGADPAHRVWRATFESEEQATAALRELSAATVDSNAVAAHMRRHVGPRHEGSGRGSLASETARTRFSRVTSRLSRASSNLTERARTEPPAEQFRRWWSGHIPYSQRGWCALELAAAVEFAAHGLAGPAGPPKLVDIAGLEPVPLDVSLVSKRGGAGYGSWRPATRRAIRRAFFTEESDRYLALLLYEHLCARVDSALRGRKVPRSIFLDAQSKKIYADLVLPRSACVHECVCARVRVHAPRRRVRARRYRASAWRAGARSCGVRMREVAR